MTLFCLCNENLKRKNLQAMEQIETINQEDFLKCPRCGTKVMVVDKEDKGQSSNNN